MTINAEEKLDLLWKHFKGVAPTSSDKAAHNERYTSASPLLQGNFWTDSDRIPVPAPLTDEATGNELWFDVIRPLKSVSIAATLVDPTTNSSAYHSMTNVENGIIEANRIRNWVPPSVDRSYSVRVWAGKPGDVIVIAQRLAPDAEGFEWEFDYSTGILYFPNETPAVAKQNGIWIEGWRYVGEIGREGSSGGGANTSKIRTLSFTTGILAPGAQADFTLETGGKCILVEAKVSSMATLECHAVSTRGDTNPYRFKAVTAHLVDDGSYTVAGDRYYGERFIPLINMEDTTSDVTYWRVINDDTAPRMITVIVSVS